MSADPVAPAESSAFWQSVQRAQAAVQSLYLILGSLPDAVASSENPAAALLNDEAVAREVSIRLRRHGSGAGDDNLCRWLYDTFQSNDPDLQLVVLTFTPTIAGVYLLRAISREPLAGFEAVLLALYAYETVIRGGDPETVNLPNLANPSVYHEAKAPPKKGAVELDTAVVSPALEPYGTVRSTKRARIVGVALELYYSKISSMPLSSKLAFCEFCMVWAGQDIGTKAEGERSVSGPAGIAPAPAAEHVEEEAVEAAAAGENGGKEEDEEKAASAEADENGGKEEVGEKAAASENGGKEEGEEKAASAEADENGGKEEVGEKAAAAAAENGGKEEGEEKAASAEADENGGKEEVGEKAAAENGGKEEGEEKAAADETGGKEEVGEKAAAAENSGKEEGEEKAASAADENSGKEEGEEKAAAADENDGKEEGGEKTAAVGADENGGKDEGEAKAAATAADKNGGKEAGEVKAGRIPLPWELFQPIVRIVGHCLLGPANPEELKTTAYAVVERLHWRATHDMNPQEILATRSLLRLGKMGDDTIAEPQISTNSDDYSEEALKMNARLT
ncbi:uncharacterized protein LOC135612195 [Musa acuminata AAA Group]|uniref:uncharacterized protein LOC135612195 n=1 Tax=Musa acuminata AAA Group TaxID=214697 RepID=UPI0031CEAA3D